ncbi:MULTISPECIES: L-2-hydroxyglutarate oxidase [Roseobacteraceae]|uniref:L-2-hydroxyglutarate oxidase n=2 Tax=Rhodobacterales TaxID=204455 RepID=UPI0007C30A4B|nr:MULTISPECIES: L-2-hydroxyglutarate oxidase [unclassified Sulfitobacter]KZX93828.1 hypothetical protein A3721_11235 [Sulfitobacter sp. HI0023]KZY49705.1 hypothetical protein A3734_09690 [Sulfitobacter sp. HI0054]
MQSSSDIYDLAIIGAGIVGLATAHFLHQSAPDRKIVVIDKESGPGLHQTGHNSGVIHAGIYYAPGSLKAKLCTAGAKATKDFCDTHKIAYENCGKLIVATDASELSALDELERRATQNGQVVQPVSREELAEREPMVLGVQALFSPASGIVDYGEICRVLHRRLESSGVDFLFGQAVTGLEERTDNTVVTTSGGALSTRLVVACAGLQADRIAALSGVADDFRIIPFRGEYYRVADRSRMNAVNTPIQTFLDVQHVNLVAPLMLCQELIEPLRRAKGSVVNVSSIAAQQVHPFAGAAYAVSKSGLTTLTRELAHELGDTGVRVNSVAPGEIETSILSPGTQEIVDRQVPMRRLGRPEEVAEVVHFLASTQSSYVTGSEIPINGGQHI